MVFSFREIMKKIIVIVFLFLLLSIAAFIGYYFHACKYSEPEWLLKPCDRGEILRIVSANGSLAAFNTVEVGCQVSGIIASVSVDFNDRVKAGQMLAQIDPSLYEVQLVQARANLDGVKASERKLKAQQLNCLGNIEAAKADVEMQRANLQKAEIGLQLSKRNLKRIEGMYAKHMISAADLDDAKSAVQSAEALLEGNHASLRGMQARHRAAHYQVEAIQAELEGEATRASQARANIEVAEINLRSTRVLSPIDGVVISRKISVGQTVAASFQAPNLFTIANDLRHMQIEALIDESDICRVKSGQPATFTVDAYPDRKFSGLVSQVRLAPNLQNVVMYTVIIDVENADQALSPGITTKVEILVDRREDVLRVPTHALFFTPPKDILARFPQKISDQEATDTVRIWVIASNSHILPIEIHTGISNALHTEVLGEPFASGTKVVSLVKEWWMGWVNQ